MVTTKVNSEGVPLIMSMLEYLDESAVAASMGTLLFFPVKLQQDRERRKAMYKYLEEHQLIKYIIKRIAVKGDVPHFWSGIELIISL